MNYNQLIDSANRLQEVNASSAEEYSIKMDKLIGLVNAKMNERNDLYSLIGENELMMKDNHNNHAHFIYSMLVKFNTKVLVNTILWVFRSYLSHGFSANYWRIQLALWLEVLEDELSSESFNKISSIYHWMLSNVDNFASIAQEELELRSSNINV